MEIVYGFCYNFFMNKIKIGKYRHFKGKEYRVLGVVHHSEDLSELVVYQALYDSEEFGKDALWARPVEMFLGTKIISGKEVQRFEYIGG